MGRNHAISRRNVLALAAGAATLAFAARAAQAGAARPVVIELFTSQGCSSCPVADALMGELRRMKGVIALSYNVDYWDYLGWRDTLASPEKSQRQYDYAKARGDMDVYTPQVVVDGGSHYGGSNKSAILKAMARAQAAAPREPVGISLTASQHEFIVEIGKGSAAQDATLWLMPLAPSIAVKIEKGENAGKDIVYYNVVRKLVPAGMWHGAATVLTLPKQDILLPDCRGAAALLQQGKAGPILAAAAWGETGA
jgi:hypothetical protein